jgi:hypothetical protein
MAPLSEMKAAQPAASARQVRPPAVEAAAVQFGQAALRSAARVASDAKVQPPEEAVVGEPDVPPVEEAAAPAVAAEPQQVAGAEVPGAAAARLQAAAPGAAVEPQPAVEPAPWGRRPGEHPSALPWVCHPDPGLTLP